MLSKPQKSLAYLLETYCGVSTNKMLQVGHLVLSFTESLMWYENQHLGDLISDISQLLLSSYSSGGRTYCRDQYFN